MEWTQSVAGYYLDFVAVPILMLLVLGTGLAFGPSLGLVIGAAAGFGIWTFLEYWIHRELFHHVMRREHWLHHKRPRGFVSAPWFVTLPLHFLTLGALWGSLGHQWGSGLFLGLEFGYMGYVVVHDMIHHGKRLSAYIKRRAALHDAHHTHASEKNFGVASSFWDHVFGTYQPVDNLPSSG